MKRKMDYIKKDLKIFTKTPHEDSIVTGRVIEMTDKKCIVTWTRNNKSWNAQYTKRTLHNALKFLDKIGEVKYEREM